MSCTRWLSCELVQCLELLMCFVSAETSTPAVFGQEYTANDGDHESKTILHELTHVSERFGQ